MSDTRTVLVTGANGFIGRALCGELKNRGYGLRAAVRSLDGTLPADRVIIGDISRFTGWNEALSGVDAVVHLAARVDVDNRSAEDPESRYRLVNRDALAHLAKCAADSRVKRLVYVSTVCVNGEKTASRPFAEDDLPAPDGPYARSKHEAELALMEAAEKSGLEAVILRAPLVYGPGVRHNFLKLMRLADRNVPLPFLGMGNRRSLVALPNLVDAIVTALTHPKAANRTYFVSDGEDVSTGRLYRTIARHLGRKPWLLPAPKGLLRLAGRLSGRESEISRLVDSLTVDTTRIQSELRWTPPVTFDDGIRLTAEWYRERQG